MGFVDDIAIGLASSQCLRLPVLKSTIASQAAAGWTSMWRATGYPAQAAIPGAAAIPTKATLGSLDNFPNPASGKKRYLAQAELNCSNNSTTIWLVDRIAHMGGLNGTLTTAQTVGVDVNSLKGTRAAANLENVRWWLEIYTAIGTTAQTCSIVYVSDTDASTQTITGFAIGGASPLNAAGRLFPITPLAGHPIRSVTSLQIGVSTGAAGSFGITATVDLGSVGTQTLSNSVNRDWAQLPIAELPDDACIMLLTQNGTTSSGNIFGSVAVPEITIPA